MSTEPAPGAASAPRLYHAAGADPEGELIDRSGLTDAELDEIGRIMTQLAALRAVEDELSAAAERYMRLNRSDMRALHFLIVAENDGIIATPGAIAAHLGISSASTTKLLDRLEHAGHVTRSTHPSDRRALAITVTPETRKAAMETVGAQQSRRFFAAARLTPQEREIVLRFLTEMTEDLAHSASA